MLGKLIVSIKDKLARSLQEPDLALAFRQIERWASDSSNFVPTGAILPYLGTQSVGTDYLLCNGLSYLRSSFPELAALIGGVGNTFTVPNLNNGLFLRGGAPGGTGGSSTHNHPLSSSGRALIAMSAVAGLDNLFMNRVSGVTAWNANLANQTTMTFGGTGAPTGQTVGAALSGSTDASLDPAGLPPFYQVNWIVKT